MNKPNIKHVFFLGPVGTFSSQVALKLFDPKEDHLVACSTFDEIVEQLTDTNHLGILPIENSISNNVHQVIDLIIKNQLSIVDEAFLSVNFNLVGIQGAELTEIRNIIAHPMAAAQCENLIKSLGVKVLKSKSNIHSQELLLTRNDSNFAALTNEIIVDTDNIQILKKNVADYQHNYTRFVVVSREPVNLTSELPKISLLFKTHHQPGSLAKILSKLAAHNLNLTKIESRPIPGTNWEYLFWIDLEKNDYKVNNLVHLLENEVSYFNIIGLYQMGKTY